MQPFLMGCGTKEPKITQLCLAAIQRLMSHEVVSEVGHRFDLSCLFRVVSAAFMGKMEAQLISTAKHFYEMKYSNLK